MAKQSHYDSSGKLKKDIYNEELEKLQKELVKLQYWIKEKGLKVCVIFEGRDAAGKGGVIKTISQVMSSRVTRIVALTKPTEIEKTQWYFQRYVKELPRAGEMVLFDRSWYNRAGVEKVMGFCTDEEYEIFMENCPQFEDMLIRSGIILVKYWFSISDKVQKKRFEDRNEDPMKRWKLSPMDLHARTKWVDYSRAKDEMFEHTDTKNSPWYVVNADIKRHARLNCISHLLDQIDYEDLTPETIHLPPLDDEKYTRPPIDSQNWVPAIFGENPDDDERS
ncbi:MAG: polyphosphate kinase 2 [Balneolaceae bacterium]